MHQQIMLPEKAWLAKQTLLTSGVQIWQTCPESFAASYPTHSSPFFCPLIARTRDIVYYL